jgi:phosphopantetheine--protein transferase-like protein
MPLFMSKTVFEDSKLGVWSIEEDEQYFSNALQLSPHEHLFVDEMKGRRKEEWLSSRHLIHLMSNRDQRAEILKDEFGKPYIHDSDHHISFSHSHGMSAAIASLDLVGIDIQYIVPKITRIAPKFMNESEKQRMAKMHSSKHVELMHIIWGAKESLFKAYGKKSVDFKKHMNVVIHDWNHERLSFHGQFLKEDFKAPFQLVAEKIENYILVYAKQT